MGHDSNEATHLSKRMAQLGLYSRRRMGSYIEQGWVKVNGRTAAFGQKMIECDHIGLNRQAHKKQAERVTVLPNKPVGYVSAQAEKGYKSATKLITADNRWEGDDNRIPFSEKHKLSLVPVNRLDIDSVGLLALMQNGRIAKQLIGESSGNEREYLMRVCDRLDERELTLPNHGLSLDGEKLRPTKVKWQSEDQLHFVLKQGKERQIRHIHELVGLRVIGLERIRMGKVKLGRLPSGKQCYLWVDGSF